MARPIKNNAEYFPHYTSMRNHRKVKILRNRFGSVLGYAFWSMMLEFLTDQDGLEWELNEIEKEMFAAELGISSEELDPIIDFCLKIELLFKSENGFIYSDSLNEILKPVFDKRRREREKSKARQRREKNIIVSGNNSHGGGVTAADTALPRAESTQSKVEYSKVEYISNNMSSSPQTRVEETRANKSVSHEEKCQYFMKVFNETKLRPDGRKSGYRINDKIRRALKLRLNEGYTSKDFVKAIKNCMNNRYHIENGFTNLTPEFILRPDKLEVYLNAGEPDEIKKESTQMVY